MDESEQTTVMMEEPAQIAEPVDNGARAPRFKSFIAVALVAGLAGGALGAFVVPGRGRSVSVENVSTPTGSNGSTTLSGVSAVAKRVIPSIVRIDVSQSGTFGGGGSGTGSGVIFTS